MYSYADRLRAVELNSRLGKRLNATIHQLEYPIKNELRGWYREYVQHLDLRVQAVARAPRRPGGRQHLSSFARTIVVSLRR